MPSYVKSRIRSIERGFEGDSHYGHASRPVPRDIAWLLRVARAAEEYVITCDNYYGEYPYPGELEEALKSQ